jgi:hypothetical protein
LGPWMPWKQGNACVFEGDSPVSLLHLET